MTRRAGVLINPFSGRNNGKGEALYQVLKDQPGLSLHRFADFAELEPAIDQCAKDGVTDLFISSGDGTIQAILTHVAGKANFKTLPQIGLLPHGTTNLTAGDIGLHIGSIAAQARFIKTLPDCKVATRHTIHVLNPVGAPPRLGFTLGAGAAARATRSAQVDYNDKGVKGSMASFATIAVGLAKAAFSKPKPGDLTRLDRASPMTVTCDGKITAQGNQLMFVATTLNHLFFRTQPFWGARNGALRTLTVAYPPPNILRWALPLMYGRIGKNIPPGCVSFTSDAFEISCPEPYVMDGEFFDGPAQGALRVQAGPEFKFILGAA
ncbi:diacylglycerol/lipid kinase family protein [Aestuariivirga litoralis]|uniref:diacylglycerol/lipid kinase family protein n=1 Tax=Aestuariivirga litoralis TaxID=2650924 RepID=UPI0018C743DD|nr:diacylglycerol kinase family protein [Aestuariivirga litoralis]